MDGVQEEMELMRAQQRASIGRAGMEVSPLFMMLGIGAIAYFFLFRKR